MSQSKLSIKEKLELLRGEPIPVFAGDPLDIPCIETSDPECLCKHPVVSVNMITYNHEPYIRQAIEGVMMQKTDFEFELVIGEDCSTDRTREICFEYQKRYPDKIRVLWWHENLRKVNHSAGCNGARTFAHCRGEFIAFCEGDDYWTDSGKLQKQVDIMRRNPSVGLVFAQSMQFYQEAERSELWQAPAFPAGFMTGEDFFRIFAWGSRKHLAKFGPESFIMTATTLVRRAVLEEAKRRFEIFTWRLAIGDAVTWLGCASLSDVYYLMEPVGVYRIHSGGAMATNGARTMRDGILTRMFFSVAAFNRSVQDAVARFRDTFSVCQLNAVKGLPRKEQRQLLVHYLRHPLSRSLFLRLRAFPAALIMFLGLVNRRTALWCSRFIIYLPRLPL